MDEHDGLARRCLQVGLQPLDLIRWNIRVGPLEVLAAIRLAVAAEASVEDDEMQSADIKRVMRLVLTDTLEELVLGERLDAMVAQDVVLFARQGGEVLV